MRRIYLDTNVYHFLTERSEATEFRRFLDSAGLVAVASAENLFETWAAPTYETRTSRIQTIVTVAATYDDEPHSLRHCREVLHEIRRCRPGWLRRTRDKAQQRLNREFLREHRGRWEHAKANLGERPDGFDVYQTAARTADLESQKDFRRAILTLKSQADRFKLELKIGDPELNKLTEAYEAWETYSRYTLGIVWTNAIYKRHPAMRDYLDWLSPYVRADRFRGDDYLRFWLSDVRLTRVRLNMTSVLANFYQLNQRVSPGNFLDAQHANYLSTTDALVTADKAFWRVLTDVRQHLDGLAQPILVRWDGPDCISQMAGQLGVKAS